MAAAASARHTYDTLERIKTYAVDIKILLLKIAAIWHTATAGMRLNMLRDKGIRDRAPRRYATSYAKAAIIGYALAAFLRETPA